MQAYDTSLRIEIYKQLNRFRWRGHDSSKRLVMSGRTYRQRDHVTSALENFFDADYVSTHDGVISHTYLQARNSDRRIAVIVRK